MQFAQAFSACFWVCPKKWTQTVCTLFCIEQVFCTEFKNRNSAQFWDKKFFENFCIFRLTNLRRCGIMRVRRTRAVNAPQKMSQYPNWLHSPTHFGEHSVALLSRPNVHDLRRVRFRNFLTYGFYFGGLLIFSLPFYVLIIASLSYFVNTFF